MKGKDSNPNPGWKQADQSSEYGYDPDYLFNFMNEAYKIRSKIVHGKIVKNATTIFEINSKKLRLYELANELEQITRLSILEMLFLFKHYRNQEDLVGVINKVAIGYPKGLLRPNHSEDRMIIT